VGTPSIQAQAAYQPGDVFARRYVIEHLLGAGFQAEVYAVKNKHTGAARALKLLKARHQSNAEYVQRFLQEAEQLTSLSHHNLVRVFDAGIEDTGEVWMLMELLEGRSLRVCMRELGSASVPLSLFIVREVSRAIALAHERDVMHRDVKPENIMVTPDGVKVLDFGIAKVYGSAVPTTDRKMRTLGTIAYMAPEQVASLPPTLSVDVYALGIVLYELLAGQHPFQDVLHDALEVGKRQMFHTPQMISTRIVGVPDYVETILNGALEKNRAHRTNMATLATQLDEAFTRFERDAERGDIAWHLRAGESSYFETLVPKSSLRGGAPEVSGVAPAQTPRPSPAQTPAQTPAPSPAQEPAAVGPYGTAELSPGGLMGAVHPTLEPNGAAPNVPGGLRPTPGPARGTVKMEAAPFDMDALQPQAPHPESPPVAAPTAELPVDALPGAEQPGALVGAEAASAAGGPRPELSGALRAAVSRQARISRPELSPVPSALVAGGQLAGGQVAQVGDASPGEHGGLVAGASASSTSRGSSVSLRSLVSVLFVGVPLTVLATWAWLDRAAARDGSAQAGDAAQASHTGRPADDDRAQGGAARAEVSASAPSSTSEVAMADASASASPSASASVSAKASPVAPSPATPSPRTTWTKPAKPPAAPPPPKPSNKKPSGRVF